MDDLERRQETAKRYAIRQRNYRRARDRALTRLRKQYPDDYILLLDEERARDEAEGKAWVDLSSGLTNSVPATRHTAPESTNTKSKQAVRDKDKARDLGGEA
jgi:hypothetical protein